MSMTPGLVPNIREVFPEDETFAETPEAIVEIIEGEDKPIVDGAGNVLEIKHADGSITISTDGKPLNEQEERDTSSWFRNLVDEIDDNQLNMIASDLLRGVKDDLDSRKDWIEDRAQGSVRVATWHARNIGTKHRERAARQH